MAHYCVHLAPLRLIAVYSPKCASQTLRAWCTAAIEQASGEPVDDLDDFLIDPTTIDCYADHWKVFFVRDPLRRLVSFYLRWVVAYPNVRWCFADPQQRLSLLDKSFRETLFVLRHLHVHGIDLQHHLVPQVAGVEGVRFDQVVAVERLSEGIDDLARRLAISVPITRHNEQHYSADSGEMVADRKPAWFRRHGYPPAEQFYDEEALALASEVYGVDMAYYREKTGLGVIGLG